MKIVSVAVRSLSINLSRPLYQTHMFRSLSTWGFTGTWSVFVSFVSNGQPCYWYFGNWFWWFGCICVWFPWSL